MDLSTFRAIWLIDSEYQATSGARVRPICWVAHELHSGTWVSRWCWDAPPGKPPWDPFDPHTLVVSFAAPAECGVFNALGWAQPCRILDLHAEYRLWTNGTTRETALLQVLAALNIPTPVDTAEKQRWRQRCIDGGPYSIADRSGILAYCETDVAPLPLLMSQMAPKINLNEALVRGAYGVCVAEIEQRGLPIDVHACQTLATRWPDVRHAAVTIAGTRMRYQMHGGVTGTGFGHARFEEYVDRLGLLGVWPRTPTGRLCTDDDTLKLMSLRQPDFDALRQARRTLSMLPPSRITIGPDGRCRTAILPFASVTGRNQPRARTPLAYPSWMRALVRPEPGMAIAVPDYEQEEFAIAAQLSADPAMLEAYTHYGDVYLAFAIQSGALPKASVRGLASVEAVRDVYKTAMIAILYGVSIPGLAAILGLSAAEAGIIVARHRRIYRRYWEWSDAIATAGQFYGSVTSSFGWHASTARMGERTIRNFPVQSTGGDILRTACILARDTGIHIVALIHDAAIIEAPDGDIDDAVRSMQKVMEDASERVLGFRVRVDAKQVVRSGQRYFKNDKARDWWNAIWARLGVAP
jgi:DNA polymerase I